MITVDFVHLEAVDENQADESDDWALLSEPKAQRHIAKLNVVQRPGQQNRRAKRNQCPNTQQDGDEPDICTPIGITIFLIHETFSSMKE